MVAVSTVVWIAVVVAAGIAVLILGRRRAGAGSLELGEGGEPAGGHAGYIDRADYHVDSQIRSGRDPAKAGQHIGYFFCWVVERGLVDPDDPEPGMYEGLVDALRSQTRTPLELLHEYRDGKLIASSLGPRGRAFTLRYYWPSAKRGDRPSYVEDLGGLSETGDVEDLPDDLATYDRVVEVLDRRFGEFEQAGPG